ncbi:MAG: FHA domain-containing protein [Bryobacteraceae bacterium]|nr:FHA domain-containing protein [Bryobacteraceae bacterium]
MEFDLIVRTREGAVQRRPLTGERLTVGRAAGNDLSYPGDAKLSRNHLLFEHRADGWVVRDLDTKNGTQVNGQRLSGGHVLASGDVIHAGYLTLTFAEAHEAVEQTVVFVAQEDALRRTITTTLDHAIPVTPAPMERQVAAMARASRELSVHRSVEDLFRAILELALETVHATRGVLMTLEGGKLLTQAARGDGFRISSAVRDRVIEGRTSLLVVDVQADDDLRHQRTIVEQSVRSILAVPLQTKDEVLGLIYVDTSHVMAEFTPADLNLLTVLANIAAVRLENARLAEREQAERAEAAGAAGRLAAAISHEMNSPLGALKSSVETLVTLAGRMGGGDPERVEMMRSLAGTVRESAARLEKIIGRMQRFTHLDRAEIQVVDLPLLLGDVVAIVQATMGSGRCEVEVQAAGVCPFLCRPQTLSAVLAKLLQVAAEESAGRGPVRVRAGMEGSVLEVEIADSGEGMKEEEAQRLFEPSFRVSKGRVKGSWSLFSARRMMSEQGGDIRVWSVEGRGTTYVVRLPVSPAPRTVDTAERGVV